MEIGNWRATKELNESFADIERLGLERNALELEAFGFTVIENAISPDTVEALRQGIFDALQQRTGRRPDPDTGETHPELNMAHYLLFRGEAFEHAVLNERPLALITYLLGRSCLLSSMTSHVKGPGKRPLALHSDNGNGIPSPFPAFAQVANCNYVLSDYTRESGAFAVVPGSHRLCRHPVGPEVRLGGEDGNPDAIPVEVPAGSAIVFHGNTWHGSYPRLTPGLRVNLAVYFCRRYLATQERFGSAVAAEDQIARLGPRFARLMGSELTYGWGEEGPDMTRMGYEASRSQHG
ncbi:MAG TPA: phytanoyl-CoA dioxygenase family protein [Acidimicrobiales bacterium]|nr:phytanoyl-CoA dioxygenase family protein [Acidimicrobiales bacterium]